MLINLSYDPDDVKNFLIENPTFDTSIPLLDVTGVCQGIYPNTRVARKLEGGRQTERNALTDFVQTVGKLSQQTLGNRNLRSYQVNGLPVFWLTGLAQKHDYYHWGQSVFFLKHLLRDFPRLFDTHPRKIIIVSKRFGYIEGLVRSLFPPHEEIVVSEKEPHLSYNTIIFLLIRFFLQISKHWLLPLHDKAGIRNPSFVFFGSLKNKTTRSAHAFAKGLGNAAVIPENVYDHRVLKKVEHELPDSFLRCRPTVPQLVSLSKSILLTYRQLLKANFGEENDALMRGLIKATRVEMLKVLQYPNSFWDHRWMQNYFQPLSGKTKVLYEDELSVFGRLVSSAARQVGHQHMTTYGLQHGLISENHTVYRFTENELTDQQQGDSLPLPDYFLVWGELFKKRLLQDNNLLHDRIVVLGSLTHQVTSRIARKEMGPELRFLWCTTAYSYALLEYTLLKNGLFSLKHWHLTIRLHPVAHMTESQMVHLLDPEIRAHVHFDNTTELADQIAQHDIVIASGQSTIFLDVLLAGKTVFRMDLGLSFIDDLDLDTPTLRSIRDYSDFNAAIADVYNTNQFAFETDAIFYGDKSCWSDFFS